MKNIRSFPDAIAGALRTHPTKSFFTQKEWDELISIYPSGTPVSGNVIRCRIFGVFIKLDQIPAVPALLEIIHFKVVDTKDRYHIKFPEDYPEVGSQVEARILAWSLYPKDVRLTQLSHLNWV